MIWILGTLAIAAASFLVTCLILDLIEFFFGGDKRK